MVNGWKVATIVLAVICFFLVMIVIIETIAVVAFFSYSFALDEMEAECANEICGPENYTYYFNENIETCYCYSGDEVVLRQEIEW